MTHVSQLRFGDDYVVCRLCGRLFEPVRTTQIYCTRKCANKAQHIRLRKEKPCPIPTT